MVLYKASGSGYESGYTKYKQELIIVKLKKFSFTLMGSFKQGLLNRARTLFLGKLSLGIKLHPCCVWSIVKLLRAGLRIRTARKTGSRSGRIKFLKTHGIFSVTVKYFYSIKTLVLTVIEREMRFFSDSILASV